MIVKSTKTKGVALLVIGSLAGAAVLLGVALELQWLRLAAKPVIMLCLMGWIWPARNGYTRWILAGLFFSIWGGLLLEMQNLFIFGLAAFLLAHLAYIGAYLSATRALKPLQALPFLVYGALVYWMLSPGLGAMAVPVGIYILAICVMMWRAAARVGAAGTPTRGEWAALVGAILFALSDTLIGYYVFLEPTTFLNYPILLLYWAGQIGIAYSAREIPH